MTLPAYDLTLHLVDSDCTATKCDQCGGPAYGHITLRTGSKDVTLCNEHTFSYIDVLNLDVLVNG